MERLSTSVSGRSAWWWSVLRPTALIVLVVAVYAASLPGPMVFDDLPGILANPAVQTIWPLHQAMDAPANTPLEARPLAQFSFSAVFAVQEAIGVGGFHPAGHRGVNVALHALAALLLMGVVRRLAMRSRLHRQAGVIGFVVALVWAVHPINTDTVAYIVQRSKGLEGLMLLGTLYAFMRAVSPRRDEDGKVVAWEGGHPDRRRYWLYVSVGCCLLGMMSKESMAGTPLIVLLTDRQFVAGTFKRALRQRWRYYAGLFATWGVLVYLMMPGGRAASVGWHLDMGPMEYLLTQGNVIAWYLGLMFWPGHLMLHHEWGMVSHWSEAVAGCTLVGLLGVLTLWGIAGRRWWGVAGAVFFLLLGPTSSLIPMTTEVVAERRMYLPSAAVIAAVVVMGVMGWRVVSRWEPRQRRRLAYAMSLALGGAVVGLSARTVDRSFEFRDQAAHWEAVLEVYPHSAMAWNSLGVVYNGRGERQRAVEMYEKAAGLATRDFVAPHLNLARAAMRRQAWAEALELLNEVERRRPTSLHLWAMRGSVALHIGDPEAALMAFGRIVEIEPGNPAGLAGIEHARRMMVERAEALSAVGGS
ncbi:MAG: tetratricopeptide repeat protein [Planctomycetota bacterium]